MKISIKISGGVTRGIKNENHAKKWDLTAISVTIYIRANNCSIRSI